MHRESRLIDWASVLMEPMAGCGERITVAVAAMDDLGNRRVVGTVQPKMARLLFADQAGLYQDMVTLAVESLSGWSAETGGLEGWTPPLAGMSLGTIHQCHVESVDVALERAMHMVSFLHRGTLAMPTKQPRVRWERAVRDGLLERDSRLANNVNAKIHLADRDVPATFTFLSAAYAANVVSFEGASISRAMNEARAKAWSLDRIGDAPSILFRPERRELLAGLPHGDGPRRDDVLEAVAEIQDEAQRRHLSVICVDSPETTIAHILRESGHLS